MGRDPAIGGLRTRGVWMHKALDLKEFLKLPVSPPLVGLLSQTSDHEWTDILHHVEERVDKVSGSAFCEFPITSLTQQQILGQRQPEHETPSIRHTLDISQQSIAPLSLALFESGLEEDKVFMDGEYDYLDEKVFTNLPSQLPPHNISISSTPQRQCQPKLDQEIGTPLIGFVTAAGRPLKGPSEAAIQRANQLISRDLCEDLPLPSNHNSVGFATASGKTIKSPSKVARQKAWKALQNEMNAESTSFLANEKEIKSNNIPDEKTFRASFATASGKKIANPSKSAMDKAQSIWDEESRDIYVKSDTGVVGFATVSGKRLVSPSKETKTRAQKILASTDDITGPNGFIVHSEKLTISPREIKSQAGKPPRNSALKPIIKGFGLKPARNMSPKPSHQQLKGITSHAPITSPAKKLDKRRMMFEESIEKHALLLSRTPLRDFSSNLKGANGNNLAAKLIFIDQAPIEEWKIWFPLADERWIKNHSREIYWKLASYSHFGIPSETSLARQLEYRYYREFDLVHRSVLKKICERDENPSRYIVLYVVEIVSLSESCREVKLSDGWYTLTALVDGRFMTLVKNGRIKIGTKIKVALGQIISEEACDILDAETKGVRLKIHSNSIAPTRWYSKLGAQKSRIFVKSLAGISLEGGAVCCVRVNIIRRFPPTYSIEHESGMRTMLAEDQIEAYLERVREQNTDKILSIRLIIRALIEDALELPRKGRAYITVWDGGERWKECIKEGAEAYILNIKVGNTLKNGLLQLFASKSSHIRLIGESNCSTHFSPIDWSKASLIVTQQEYDMAGIVILACGGYCWILVQNLKAEGTNIVAVKYLNRRFEHLNQNQRIALLDVPFLYCDPRHNFYVFLFGEGSQLIFEETKLRRLGNKFYDLSFSESELCSSLDFVHSVIRRESFR